MLWEVEIFPLGRDGERERVCDEFDRLTHSTRGADLVTASSRGYLLDGAIDFGDAARLAAELLVDPIVERVRVGQLGEAAAPAATVLFKPGVMDPTAESVLRASADLAVFVTQVRTFRRYFGPRAAAPGDVELLHRKILANDAIEQVVAGPLAAAHLALGRPYTFRLQVVPIRDADDAALADISRRGQLALTLEEMRTIQTHFRDQGREPTDCELETLAQTWSEHCSHKTLKGTVRYTETTAAGTRTHVYQNLLKETVFAATQEIRRKLGASDWCVSVFSDNAGIVKFSDEYHVCFKVETHNRPSALEPYGGANTGLGGVIRDVLGTGLGGKPVCNTDVFCFAPADIEPSDLPPGVLHPRRVIHGVVAGVRDYGNRMGIPTVNGSVTFDPRYLANPLVFCGTVGLIPVGMEWKKVTPGELIVAVGGRTGRDGIHGATFSSLELTHESEVLSGGAVQIGNAITEKKVLDVILQARDRRLYASITDCGAGGFSSAVGEMAAECGADVELSAAPLKYDGLSYTEIWISESQERMVLSVPEASYPELEALCRGEDVEVAVLGRFTDRGRLTIAYNGERVADLDMRFLHDGRPHVVREATWTAPVAPESRTPPLDAQESLKKILASGSVASKEWIVRQYDHEVQGGSVVKPLVGAREDGPSDAAVVRPVPGGAGAIVLSNGLNPRYADLDPWSGAACAIDEAVRNAVAVGADPARIAILDNFCWGNVIHPEMFGALVRTAEACRDVAIAYGTPFVSGKDSLNNEYRSPDRRITIPHTLLVSALGVMPDAGRAVTMDLKAAGNDLYVVGVTKRELGGSHLHLVAGLAGGTPPKPDLATAPKLFAALHRAISAGLVRSCHDLSEGGLAVALAEMVFAGEIGAVVPELAAVPTEGELSETEALFSESATRWVIEAAPASAAALAGLFAGLPFAKIGTTTEEARLRVGAAIGATAGELKAAWQTPQGW